jgi:hypothetical protein
MRTLTNIAAAVLMASGLAAASVPADAQTSYTINGRPAPVDVQRYMAMNRLPPGHYWLDRRGYWGVAGSPNPVGNIYAGSYASRHGSGGQASNGWSHYSNSAGTWVGGDNNGCVYTPNWSNC